MLLVYSEKITPRLEYILEQFFNHLLKTGWELTGELARFENYLGPKLNYSLRSFDNSVSISPHGLLAESGLRPVQTDVSDFETSKAFFWTVSPDFPFDPFAAAFYLLSRYEEYMPFQPDRYGRFEADQSLAFKQGFLQKPVVDQWAHALKITLNKAFPTLTFAPDAYRFFPSIDVDNVYAYKGKGLLRSAGAFVKSFLKADSISILERARVLTGKLQDPFDTYSLQEKLILKNNLRLIYFFLFAERSKHDHALSPENPIYRSLVKRLAGFSLTGIHPSWNSDSKAGLILNEKNELERACGKSITQSRQHFLKMSLPLTYRNLITAGISEDYSMGFASACGFRAGTCSPFHFFDLISESATQLQIFPFSAMDVTFSDYQKTRPADALLQINRLIQEIKKVNGMFISVWHDRSFSERHYPGWAKAFEEMISLAKES